MTTMLKAQNIVVIDGECVLCNRFTSFLLKIDKSSKLLFTSNSSQWCKKNLENISSETVIYLVGPIRYEKSDAILEIFRELGSPWSIFYLFKIVPKFIRDYIYNIISKNRYRLFGKANICVLNNLKNDNILY